MTKRLTLIFGVIFVLLGLLGFVSNPLIGENALFAADEMHNLVHAIFGGILLVAAFWSREHCARWLKIVGGALILIGLVGLVTIPPVGGTLLGMAYTNGAYNWFHLIAGAIIFGTGVYEK